MDTMVEPLPEEIGASFVTYVVLILIRVSGIADLIRAFDMPRVIFLNSIQDVAQFIFYDFFFLTLIGIVSSGLLMTVSYYSHSEQQYRIIKLISATGTGVPALMYVIGSIYIFLF